MTTASDSRPLVLVVDDEPMNIKVLVDLLENDYRLAVAKTGHQALQRLESGPVPDLILLDVMMPGMDGHDLCRVIKGTPRYADIPVIFVTALADAGDEAQGFALGAVDYLTKPISPAVTQARVRTHLKLRQARRVLEDYSHTLEAEVRQRSEELMARTREVVQAQDVTIRALASLAETRDNETGNHIRRTQHYVRILAEALVAHPRFAPHLDGDTIDLLFKSAPLHDVGKVGIPDAILLKPGRLTDDEMAIMKSHAELGRQALLAAAEDGDPHRVGFLRFGCDIAGGHHEKWDGSGYPRGLAGEDIPFAARLMAVADVYDALISRRVYKPAFPHDKAMAIIREGHGTHFDPAVVEALLAREDEVRAIATRYADPDTDTNPDTDTT
ncbi:response regulator [Roseospira goensis]|uniref:Putative two-component system response regulator n=1 Tax=Roseospira goensis TaxID=391922 RepID=A0A7W6WKH6_9PROT|nr:two-component system response regulator [Roseospira goensis]MBB4285764.1 putative two-component system response regulator [Roseospira goensis]